MILIDGRDPRPIYEQIVEKLAELMVCGALAENSPMPSVRSLAADLSVTPNTVQRAYAELERLGYIVSIRGKGSFVADTAAIRRLGQEKILTELGDLALRASRAGIEKEQFLARAGSLWPENNTVREEAQ